jgi:hypothetical protein
MNAVQYPNAIVQRMDIGCFDIIFSKIECLYHDARMLLQLCLFILNDICVASKLFAENGCLKERYGTVCFHLHCRGRGIDCTNAAATSHIQSMMLRIGMLLEEKIERFSDL